MSFLNGLLRAVFDGLLFPFRGLPAIVGLTVVSLVTAVLMLLIFKATSNQERLAEVKRRIHGGLFEIRLFNDDLRAILRAQGEILRHNLTYLRLSAVPLVWILPPLLLIMAQLQFHYAYEGFSPGARPLLEVDLAEEWAQRADVPAADGRPQVTLEMPDGLSIDSPPVWVPEHSQMAWRLAVDRPGEFELRVRLGDESFSKSVTASADVVRRAPERPQAGFLRELIVPAESPLPGDGPLRQITVSYPEAEIDLGLFEVGTLLGMPGWMVVFFVLTIVFAFALRNRLGVTI